MTCVLGRTARAIVMWYSIQSSLPALLFALVAHAGVNVLNDYYDHLNGTDAANLERIFPC